MDMIAYFNTICNTLKLTAGKYTFCKVTGLANLEEVLFGDRKNKYWMAIDKSQDGNTFRGGNASFFEKRFHTVFLLFRINDRKNEYDDKMEEVRTIYRKIHSKLIRDRNTGVAGLQNIDLDIRFNEIEYIGNDCAGLMFHVTNDEATNLVYDAADWN